MPEAEVFAIQQTQAIALAILLVLISAIYVVYRIAKARKRRIERQKYVENNPGRDENWFAK
ncbi:hypothetical protein KAH43_01155 [Candidatus Bipolaricaulota bacterium]|nr:hypothetical protein [Candidatus Bipolaricaulota bacterium]